MERLPVARLLTIWWVHFVDAVSGGGKLVEIDGKILK